jgi:hypothetical protein
MALLSRGLWVGAVWVGLGVGVVVFGALFVDGGVAVFDVAGLMLGVGWTDVLLVQMLVTAPQSEARRDAIQCQGPRS